MVEGTNARCNGSYRGFYHGKGIVPVLNEYGNCFDGGDAKQEDDILDTIVVGSRDKPASSDLPKPSQEHLHNGNGVIVATGCGHARHPNDSSGED